MRKKIEIDAVTKAKFGAIWQKVMRSKLYDRMNHKERAFLRSLLFDNVVWPYLPLCNIHVEVAARQAMQQIVSDWAMENPERLQGGKRVRMITILYADQFTDFDDPIIDIEKVKDRVRRVFEALNLNGFALIEMQPTLLPRELAEGRIRRVCVHAHGYCWSDDAKFKPKVAIQKLNKTRTLKPVFGCQAVQIKAAKFQTRESLNRIVRYLGKLSAGVKKVSPTPPGSKRPYRIYSNIDGWTGPMAIRSIEMLSRFSIYDLTVASGDASQLRSGWKRTLRNQFSDNISRNGLDPDATARFWQRVMKLDPKRKVAKFTLKR